MVFNMVSTGRDSQNFNNPDVFDPDRWDKKTTKDNLTFTSLPFGFGPRMCYGMHSK
jgi:cytochrome P450